MKSPKMGTCQKSNWKDQVRATWAFVEKYYIIRRTTQCSTHVHISALRGSEGRSGFGLQDLKKIAQCVIHFEPALEALAPEERRGNVYASSLIMLMSPTPQMRFFAWNFRALDKFGTVEFRKGDASLNGHEAIAWAELVLLFVQSAVQTDRESLRAMPANIRGLKSFLGTEKLKDLEPLLDGKNDDESVQPRIVLSRSDEERALLEKKLRKDAEWQRKLAKEKQG